MDTEAKIRLVCFDLDHTLITHNSWLQLNLAMGMTEEEDAELYNAYVGGNLSYEEWMEQLSKFYRERGNATQQNIEKVLRRYEFNDGAEEIILYLQNKGYKIAVLTGSFHRLAKDVAEKLHLDAFKGNSQLIFSSDGIFEKIQAEGDEIQNKPNHLKEICEQLGVGIEECICVGDGINDVELFKIVPRGIAFTDAPEALKNLAWKTVDSLSEIKELL